jgi:hypothetical protein
MAFRLDAFPFPKGEPEGARLLGILADLYGADRDARRFVARFNIAERSLAPNLSATDFWDEVLTRLAKTGLVRDCVEAARNEFPNNPHVANSTAAQADLQSGYPILLRYLNLFDRVDETKLLNQALRKCRAPPPLPPIVVAILAEEADEFYDFVQRANANVLFRLLGPGGPKPEQIDWSDKAEITAESEFRDIAESKIGEVDDLDALLTKLGPALAGKPISFMIRSERLKHDDVVAKLGQFLELWGGPGAHAPPAVLYVNIVRWSANELSPADAKAMMEKALAQAKDRLTPVQPIILSACDVSHFELWKTKLIAEKIDVSCYPDLLRRFQGLPSFRLGELRALLQGIRTNS